MSGLSNISQLKNNTPFKTFAYDLEELYHRLVEGELYEFLVVVFCKSHVLSRLLYFPRMVLRKSTWPPRPSLKAVRIVCVRFPVLKFAVGEELELFLIVQVITPVVREGSGTASHLDRYDQLMYWWLLKPISFVAVAD